MLFQQPGRQIRHWMFAKIRRDVRDANPVMLITPAGPQRRCGRKVLVSAIRARASQLRCRGLRDGEKRQRGVYFLSTFYRLDDALRMLRIVCPVAAMELRVTHVAQRIITIRRYLSQSRKRPGGLVWPVQVS